MFRKPRQGSISSVEVPAKPSTGRPPTPPNGSRPTPSSTMSAPSVAKPLTPRPNSKTNAPLPKSSAKKILPSKSGAKPNSSILSFFKKVDSPLKDDSIFVASGRPAFVPSTADNEHEDLDDIYNGEEEVRFNEVDGPVKRLKISLEGRTEIDNTRSSPTPTTLAQPSDLEPAQNSNSRKPVRSGFLPDSDSEEEEVDSLGQSSCTSANESAERGIVPVTTEAEQTRPQIIERLSDPLKVMNRVPVDEAQAKWEAMQPKPVKHRRTRPEDHSDSDYESQLKVNKPSKKKSRSVSKENSSSEEGAKKKKSRGNSASKEAVSHSTASEISPTALKTPIPHIPSLKQEATSVDEWGGFDDLEELGDDEYGEGEELVERRWMEEQARLEAAELALLDEPFEGFDEEAVSEEVAPTCPICQVSLVNVSDDLATRHVNGCLDGNPIALPTQKSESVKKEEAAEIKFIPPGGSNRFIRKAAIARPGQSNPIQIGGAGPSGKATAFSEIMSGKAEDAAWASAAAAENASRGRPAFERTCPFYKIMPGFFICVDAFRYGAVKDCNGYFLSHFHSDHYIGLTRSWCHGPIYCSKVTANLVKQQLHVDPKWVVALEFEDKFAVPKTNGVSVTMIPANHCPGSSLFLFEKVVGRGPSPKVQRILHCGDFRACPAHISHPQLMPDLVDSLTGKTKQQKIDVCYLDTTYLNPRYAFPSQEEVIKACADMCVSLRKDRADETDAWEIVKKQRAGAGMNNFIQTTIKPEDDSIAMEIGSTKPRGRLLVICGTYSIGKERICMGIAKALDCKIWAPPGKMRICAALEDPELMSRMTDDPLEAQIHMQMLMEIRAETLQEYLNSYKPHYSRIVGFRPSGWNYRPPTSRFTDSPSIPTILSSNNWKSTYDMSELIPQRGSTREASCFGVPYSEHSSFRELTMFVCALRIEKVVPTVNVGSAASRAKMKGWIEKWLAERRKQGVIKIGNGEGEVKW